MEIELNGRKYELIEAQENKMMRSKYAGMALAMLAMTSVHYGASNKAPMPRYGLGEIVSEYELIQQKKSNLPRAQREHVINQFKKHFKEITEDGTK